MEMVGTSLRCFFLNVLGFTVQLGASVKCKGENKRKVWSLGMLASNMGDPWAAPVSWAKSCKLQPN